MKTFLIRLAVIAAISFASSAYATGWLPLFKSSGSSSASKAAGTCVAIPSAADGYFNGSMAEILVYQSVLTPTQIANLYSNPTP
jgi:hypothetical protein